MLFGAWMTEESFSFDSDDDAWFYTHASDHVIQFNFPEQYETDTASSNFDDVNDHIYGTCTSPVMTVSEVSSCGSELVIDHETFTLYVQDAQSDELYPIEVGFDSTVRDLKRVIKKYRNPRILFSNRLHTLRHSDSDEVFDDNDLLLSDTSISGDDRIVFSYKPSIAAYVQLKRLGVRDRYAAIPEAVCNEDTTMLQLLHTSGVDVVSNRSFSLALSNQNKAASLYLLEIGADPVSALSLMSSTSVSFLASLLIETNTVSRLERFNFLMYRSLRRDVKMVLHDTGLDVKMFSNSIPEVLRCFTEFDQWQVTLAKKLLTGDMNLKDKQALFHLLNRCSEVPIEILDLVISDEDYLVERNDEGQNCLHVACTGKQCYNTITYLLTKKPELYPLLIEEDNSGDIPLSLCLKKNMKHDSSVLVLEKTLDSMKPVSENVLTSFLEIAAFVRNFRMCLELLSRGAPAKWTNTEGRNLLHLHAIRPRGIMVFRGTFDKSDLSKQFINKGVNPNAYDNTNDTPLSLTLNTEIGFSKNELLEATNASILMRDSKKLLDRSILNGHTDIVQKLLKRGYVVPSEKLLQHCLNVKKYPINMLKDLIKRCRHIVTDFSIYLEKALMNRWDASIVEIFLSFPQVDKSWTRRNKKDTRRVGFLLMAIVQRLSNRYLKVLVSAGVPMGVGDNPIKYAIREAPVGSHAGIVEQLVRAVDFDPTWSDSFGRNYFQFLIARRVREITPYRILLEAGVSPNSPDCNGNSAISDLMTLQSNHYYNEILEMFYQSCNKSAVVEVRQILKSQVVFAKGGKKDGGGKGSSKGDSGKGTKGAGKIGKVGKRKGRAIPSF